MAKIIVDDASADVKDDSAFQEEAQQLGVPFGCTEGICGSCRCEVIEGDENLTEQTQEEKDMNLEPHERLLCQCKIKSGIVKFKYW